VLDLLEVIDLPTLGFVLKMEFFKRKSSPSGLAQLLFQLVLEDEKKPNPYRWEEKPEFKQDVYSNQMLVYLIASITFALAGFYSKYPRATEVQFEFRRLVINEMKTRWGYSEQKTDDLIEEAIEDYANLIRTSFTGPSAEDRAASRAASLKWAQNWVKKMGIEESNLMTLTRISFHWGNQFIHLAKYLKEVL
jgi:hypothetical protein